MMPCKLLLLVQLLCTPLTSQAHSHHQESPSDFVPMGECGCEHEKESHERRLEASQIMSDFKKRRRNLADVSYSIPIYYHILRSSIGRYDISDSQLSEYTSELNYAFRDTPFTFYIQRTRRYNNNDWNECSVSASYDFKPELAVVGHNRLNVYFCDIQNGSGGWAQMPYEAGTNNDGVVVESNYRKMGKSSSYIRPTILNHEVGHWLGLYHSFMGGCDATYGTNRNWEGSGYEYFNGDGVHDTPAHIKGKKDCSVIENTCPDDVEGVDPGNDPLDNIMSYAADDCAVNFTPGQVERMVAMYEYYRHFESSEIQSEYEDLERNNGSDETTPGTFLLIGKA